ncbi:hypothetical protein V8D89_008133 [Ganoderma adspersum]
MASVAFARVYQQSFAAHPYFTLAVTNGALNAFGDAVAQVTQKLTDPDNGRRKRQYDVLRTLRFFAFGFGMGPLIGRWNFFLERKFPLRPVRQHGSSRVSFRALARRVGADQLLMAPIGLTLFIGSMGLMEGREMKQVQQRFSDMYRPVLLANWRVWPLAQLINFRYMPLPYRVPFQSTCGVFWTLYLSLLNARESEAQNKEDRLERTVNSE